MFVWGGHSCPAPLTWVLLLIVLRRKRTNVKSGGQECPPHTGTIRAQRLLPASNE